MHDTEIRGGTIVDGTGKPSYNGDVALEDGKIAAVGGKVGPGRREIEAGGLLVTPGWVDAHTHYDGQATWDPVLAPSSWHGVTTILFGKCGVGFAPVRGRDHASLIGLMEAVEEIPGIALAEGLKWNWETFPEYLDALDQMPRSIDIAAQIPHHPLRVYVMGDRAINREKATGDRDRVGQHAHQIRHRHHPEGDRVAEGGKARVQHKVVKQPVRNGPQQAPVVRANQR